MTTTPTPSDIARDTENRSHRVPAWSGDIGDLTDWQLHERIEALGAHIGRLSTEWTAFDGWRPAADFAAQAEPWIQMRIRCLYERDRRDGRR